MNPKSFNSFMITNAYLSKVGLLISGYEYSIEDVKHWHDSSKHSASEEHLFYRLVPMNLPKI